ncbi:MAG TPA: hypothetical protein VJH71_02535 [Candidatus Paceibacterota bacterium]
MKSPLLGLSILVHFVVILVKKTRGLSHRKKHVMNRNMKDSPAKIIASLLIVVIITGTVSVAAGIMIGAGLADGNSNIKIVSRATPKLKMYISGTYEYAKSLVNFDNVTEANLISPELTPLPPLKLPVTILATCEPTQNINLEDSRSSLVDYLKKNGVSSTMEHRLVLAEKYGIEGYDGTAIYNSILLEKLLSEKYLSHCEINQ